MHFIENGDQVSYGNLSYSNDILTLNGYGSLEIIENNEDKLIAEVSLEGTNTHMLMDDGSNTFTFQR